MGFDKLHTFVQSCPLQRLHRPIGTGQLEQEVVDLVMMHYETNEAVVVVIAQQCRGFLGMGDVVRQVFHSRGSEVSVDSLVHSLGDLHMSLVEYSCNSSVGRRPVESETISKVGQGRLEITDLRLRVEMAIWSKVFAENHLSYGAGERRLSLVED